MKNLSFEEILTINGGGPTTTDTSLATDVGNAIGYVGALFVCGCKTVASWF